MKTSVSKITRRRLLRALAYTGGGVVVAGGAGGLWVYNRFFMGYEQGILEHDGRQREFIYRLPRGFNPKSEHPILIALGGAWMKGRQTSLFMAFDVAPLADKTGTVMVYPSPADNFWNPKMGGEHPAADVNDSDFLVQLIDHVSERFKGDRRRIYCLGASNGAVMAHRLACDHPDKVAGIVTMLGLMGVDAAHEHTNALPVPVLVMHGTEDKMMKWEGGPLKVLPDKPPFSVLLSAEDTIEYYKQRNKVTGNPEIVNLHDRNTKDGSTVVSCTYSGEAPVVFWKLDGGGHGVPTAGWRPWVRFMQGTNRDINSLPEAFKFLHRFARKDSGQIIELAP